MTVSIVEGPAFDHEIPVFENPRTSEIAGFFQCDCCKSLPIELATSKDEEHPDLNLDLCISLPSHSAPAVNRASSGDRTADSKPNSIGCDTGLQVIYVGYYDHRYCEQNAGDDFSHSRLV